MRPLGAIIFGHIGDTKGRKSTLLLTILFMTISTAMTGLIPLNSSFSVIVLIICRMLQGLSASGEYPGSLALLAEQHGTKRHGLLCSFSIFATGLGVLSGGLIYAILNFTLGHEAILHGGWRILFLLALPFGALTFYLRRSVAESVEFIALKQQKKILTRSPFLYLIKRYARRLLLLLTFSILAGSVSRCS